MEKNKIKINEHQLRAVIREELEQYLLEEGMLDFLKGKKRQIANIFGALALSAIIGSDTGAKAIEQIKQEITQEDVMQEFDRVASETEKKVISHGLTQQGAQQIVAGVLEGAKLQKEKELQYNQELSEDEKQKQIFEFQKQELKKLDNSTLVQDILIAKFQNLMEQQGRSGMVSGASEEGKIGAPKPVDALTIGLGIELQKTLVQYDEDITTKSKNEEGNVVLGFKPTDLKSFWGNYFDDNSQMKKLVDEALGDKIFIRYSDYEYGSSLEMKQSISKQLQRENKVRKLKKRLNEIRGLYV
jgi:phosphopantetheine adenylyltransferase